MQGGNALHFPEPSVSFEVKGQKAKLVHPVCARIRQSYPGGLKKLLEKPTLCQNRIFQEFTPRGKQSAQFSWFPPSHRGCYQIRQESVEPGACDVTRQPPLLIPDCPSLCPRARAGAELPRLTCIHPETSLGSWGL